MAYDFHKIEEKWRKKWKDKKVFIAKEDSKRKKYYVLEMYPYPSASGLHMGHAFNFVIGDVFSRFKRMNKFNVLHPMGYDSFGLPAENAAIKNKSHPKKFTEDAIKNFEEQQKVLGLTYDWSREIMSHDPNYYKWNQWIFLKMYEKDLAYRKKSPVNFCRKCNTVLANEQVHNGKCWRHSDTEVELKNLEQWFVRTTDYADELYDKVDSLNWPQRIRTMQKNWIGKSHGVEIKFEVNKNAWKIFTTRPDTIYGVTFMVVSAGHPDLMGLVTKDEKLRVEKFLKKIKSTKKEDIDKLEKEGVFTGSYATHPLTKEKIPVWVGNFVFADYGSGMVMAVPAHDQRDLEFSEKYGLGIIPVIQPKSDNKEVFKAHGKAITTHGKMINSGKFDGLDSRDAKDKIVEFLIKKKIAKKVTQFKLKDWLISRQRYWGTPIPIIYCEKCGVQPVREKDLPVKLPEKVKFGRGNPLETNKKFVDVKCLMCNGKARRETDTMDTFFDSSWYYLRFCDSGNKKEAFKKANVNYWMPVDFYTGGAEHACMHLIYARFFTKFFRDLGLVKFDEPFEKLFNQGMIHGEDGFVMSKSRGNVVDPNKIVKKYGADTLRLFLMSNASPEKDREWDEKGIDSIYKFVRKIFEFFNNKKFSKSSKAIESRLNKTIKDFTENLTELKYNYSIISLRGVFEKMLKEESISKKDAEAFLKMLSVFCPHISEELWEKMGNKNFISLEKWPIADDSKIDKNLENEGKLIEKIVDDINNIIKIVGKKENVYIYVLPKDSSVYKSNAREIEKRTGLNVRIFTVNDSEKYDPENKSKKVKPGKPGIYIE